MQQVAAPAVLKKLGVSLLSLLFALLAVEFGLWLFLPTNTAIRWPMPHDRYGFVNEPGVRQTIRYSQTNATWTVSINSLGLRGPELPLDRTNDLRVLLLGDSFTFGYGVSDDETFAARLQQRLDTAGITATVINVSAAGWGTRQQIRFASDHLNQFRPNIAVFTFCGNDHVDDAIFELNKASGLTPQFPFKRWIRMHSRIYGYIYQSLYGRLYIRLLSKNPETRVNSPRETVAQSEGQRPLADSIQQRWNSTREQLDIFHQAIAAINPDAQIIVQPAEFWLETITKPLDSMCEQSEWTYQPLEREFEGIPRNDLLLGYDPHWNARTHQRVADRLFDRIVALQRSPKTTAAGD